MACGRYPRVEPKRARKLAERELGLVARVEHGGEPGVVQWVLATRLDGSAAHLLGAAQPDRRLARPAVFREPSADVRLRRGDRSKLLGELPALLDRGTGQALDPAADSNSL